MARKSGQLISRGSRTWLVRISLGRDPETGTRKYHNKTIRSSFREAQIYLSGKLQEREIGRLPRAAAISLNQYLDQWLTTAAKPRLRPKSYIDYEALLRLHIRPVLGTRPLGAIVQFDIQSIYAQMFERGLSARTIEYTNAVLQSAFRQAVRWKMLAEDPCVGVESWFHIAAHPTWITDIATELLRKANILISQSAHAREGTKYFLTAAANHGMVG